jgi:hypothetical protein
MSAHTPGPWYTTGPNIHAQWTDDDGNVTDRWVATISAGQGDQPRLTDHANARLIAAAPALLEALERAVASEMLGKADDLAARAAIRAVTEESAQ